MSNVNYPGFLNDENFLKEQHTMSAITKYDILKRKIQFSKGPVHLQAQIDYLDILYKEAKKEANALLDIVVKLNIN